MINSKSRHQDAIVGYPAPGALTRDMTDADVLCYSRVSATHVAKTILADGLAQDYIVFGQRLDRNNRDSKRGNRNCVGPKMGAYVDEHPPALRHEIASDK